MDIHSHVRDVIPEDAFTKASKEIAEANKATVEEVADELVVIYPPTDIDPELYKKEIVRKLTKFSRHA